MPRPWRMKEIRLALRMNRLGRTEEKIAEALKRTPIDVRHKLMALALVERRRKAARGTNAG